MKWFLATLFTDDNPDNLKRYSNWSRYTLWLDGTATIQGGRSDDSFPESSEDYPDKIVSWSELPADILVTLIKDAEQKLLAVQSELDKCV